MKELKMESLDMKSFNVKSISVRAGSLKTAIVLGSSRSGGNTASLAIAAQESLNAKLFDLADYKIEPYSYDYGQDDDFWDLIDQLLKFDRIIFASPMYWYSASAQMKIFLDRLSDLLDVDKEKGRALRGKQAALLATGYMDLPPACFEQMFEMTFNYLGMRYQGMNYSSCTPDFDLVKHKPKLSEFVLSLHAEVN